MVETVLLTLAPYVLDTLLGGGEDFPTPTKMYRGGLYSGAGYRYPKTKRSIVVEYPQDFARAAIYNKGEARNEYRKTHPETDKTRKSKQ